MLLLLRFLQCCLLVPGLLYAGGLAAHAVDLQPLTGAATNASTKRIYNEAARSWYSVYSSPDTLYIVLAVTDAVQQKKLVTNGLELWIDLKGKKNKKTGIVYPFNALPNQPERPHNGNPPPAPGQETQQAGADRLLFLEKQSALQHEMRLTGFKDGLNGVQNNCHPSGIRIYFSFVKDSLLCRAQLPFNTLIESLSVNSAWSVGLVEKGSPMNDFKAGSMPPEGASEGMMPPPGSPPPGEEDRIRIFEDNFIWYRLPLHIAVSSEKAVVAGSNSKRR